MSNETSAIDGWFECFTGVLLNKLGCQLVMEPHVGKSRPDFLATTADNDEFYVEATVVRRRPFSDKPTEADVCSKLNAMFSNPDLYWFNAHAEGDLYQDLSKTKLIPVKEWVEGLSTKELRRRCKRFCYASGTLLESSECASAEWTLTIIASPRTHAYRGVSSPLLGGIGRSGAVDSAEPLVRKAKGKVEQHKDIPGPLLLTMNDISDFPSDQSEVTLALFGCEEEVEQGLSRISPRSGRRQRSLWGNCDNSTISAILLFHELTPRTLAHAEVCLYENPWPKYPIPSLLRQSFSHALVEERQGIQYLRWYPGPRLSSILGVPAEPRPYAELMEKLKGSTKGLFK